MFPHDREIPEKLLKELVGMMVHAGLGEPRPSVTNVPFASIVV